MWGTVCHDDWSDREATTLCITLDGEYTIGRAYGDVRQSLVPMWLSSVICDVNATDINTCTRATDSLAFCQFSEAAMTVCFRGESDGKNIRLFHCCKYGSKRLFIQYLLGLSQFTKYV